MPTKVDKRLVKHDTAEVRARAERGMALSSREFAAVTGLAYHMVRGLWNRKGFPVSENTITLPDYQEWKRRRFGWSNSPTSASLPHSAVGKSEKSPSRHD